MAPIDPTLLTLLVQTGFAGLAVYLIIDTRKESRERERAALAREDRLNSMLDKHVEQLTPISTSLLAVSVRMERIEREIVDAAVAREQILGLLGNRRTAA